MAPDDPLADRPSGHLALIGMMAVGKSTVGRALAHVWQRRFVDTDDLIEATTGRTVRQLWEAGGEAGYRPLERRAVEDALASSEPVVLATPGGVAVDGDMAAALASPTVTTVYLRARSETLAVRVGTGRDHRPLLGDAPATALRRLVAERDGRYEDLADHVVDVDGRSPDEVVGAVRARLAR